MTIRRTLWTLQVNADFEAVDNDLADALVLLAEERRQSGEHRSGMPHAAHKMLMPGLRSSAPNGVSERKTRRRR